MTKIVRFDCGCIGTEPNAGGRAAILIACDGDGPGVVNRSMYGTSYTDADDYDEIVWQAFVDAYKLKGLRSALQVVMAADMFKP